MNAHESTQDSGDTVHLYVAYDGHDFGSERWMTVDEARAANQHAEHVTGGNWSWVRKHDDVMQELEEPTHPHPRIRLARQLGERLDRSDRFPDLAW